VRDIVLTSRGAAPLDIRYLARGKLSTSLIGREWLWRRLIKTIRTPRRHLLLLGDSGFGKSAISVELFDRRLATLNLQPLAYQIHPKRGVSVPSVCAQLSREFFAEPDASAERRCVRSRSCFVVLRRRFETALRMP
jgi:hypothetical protein